MTIKPKSSNKPLSFIHKAKLAMAVLVGGLVFGGLNFSTSWAEEPFPIFDPAENEINKIVIGVEIQGRHEKWFGEGLEQEVKDKVVSFLENNISKLINVRAIQSRNSFKACEEQKNGNSGKGGLDDLGEIYLRVQIRSYPLSGYVTLEPCFLGYGLVRLNFPEDWSQIDPSPNIRQGSCNEEWVKDFSDYVFCRIKPDLSLIAFGINNPKGGKRD